MTRLSAVAGAAINGTAANGILMLGNVLHAKEEFSKLSDLGPVTHITSGDRESFLERCRSGEFNHIKAISRTVDSVAYTGRFDDELLSQLPSSIKFVCHNGAGYDQIDAKAARKHGITVSNTPGYVNQATADIGIFLLLGALRKAWIPQKAIRNGEWQGQAPLGHDPLGKTIGILGLGGIGTAFAERAMAFGFKIQYHNRKPVECSKAKYVSFDELLATSDVISIHLPLNDTTRHIISHKEFAAMKPGAVIINTARGAIIDENALVEALKSDKIWSIGLDVFETEPKVHPELLKDDRVMLLPHIGSATLETRKAMEIQVMDNIDSAFQHDKLVNPVN
ncbi:MAG: hypothetical protein GOMPHAMPRED_000596 [Gomphillus americanus]|uniref:Hydroxyphenylpyruvate reductase n=1 Tax=Gomphillus americanus TaxID=1940652 RepID=A0A8H3EEP9_9LECA|nr:MAG: hypothetical protein GOMPHAMPRED_000596 [Gomphillus americanus]